MRVLYCLLIPLISSLNSLFGNVLDPHPTIFERKFLHAQEIAVIQLSFDGINTFHCGVGTVVLQTQSILKELNECYKGFARFKLYLISADYSPQLNEYSTEILKKNIKDCEISGGEVCLIPTSKNDQMFGDREQWEDLCEKGAKICARIINENKFTIIIAHDTAYAHLPYQLHLLHGKEKIQKPYKVIWLPHSTSWSYNGHTEEGSPLWPERHQWELEACQHSFPYSYQIGYINSTFKTQMTAPPFNVPEASLLFFRTGILLDKYLNVLPEDMIAIELSKRNIPLNKRLIFSIGRATPLKGHDITLEVYRHLKNIYSDIHLVMLAPPSDYMPSYSQQLINRITRENLEVTLINEFDPDLAHYIYQWPKTSLVSLLSRQDTQPLTVMEARANPKNCVVLVSDPERIGRQVNHKLDGFICSVNGLDNIIIEMPCVITSPLKEIVECSCDILNLSENVRKKIVEEGRKIVSENYDLRKNIIKNLIDLMPMTD